MLLQQEILHHYSTGECLIANIRQFLLLNDQIIITVSCQRQCSGAVMLVEDGHILL